MAEYRSFLAPLIADFVYYREASGCWNTSSYEPYLVLFDRYCSKRFPGAAALTWEMVDGWCRKRDTEAPNWLVAAEISFQCLFVRNGKIII